MALIPCPHCGRNLSDRAKSCPACGQAINTPVPSAVTQEQPAPVAPKQTIAQAKGGQTRSRIVKWGGLILLVIFLPLLLFPTGWLEHSENTPAPQAEQEVLTTPDPQEQTDTYYDSVTQERIATRPDDGLYPQTRHRKLTSADLQGLSSAQLRIMRNEIFARHGYAFQTTEMRTYFEQQSWYRAVGTQVNLSSIESYNVEFIKRHE